MNMWRNITEQISNFSSLDDEMQTLGSKIESLSCRADDVIAMLQDAEFRTGKKRKREVENWLDNVQKKKNEFQCLQRVVQGCSVLKKLPLGKRVEKMIGEVVELIDQGQFPEGLLLNVHDTKAVPLLTTKLIGQQFKQNLEKVHNYLMKEDIMYIGIYGMGGSGKTTLATHIHNLLLKSSATSSVNVYWLTVSQDWSVDKLQYDIANLLKLDLTRENERNRRAAKLSQALRRMKKFVLILDDVWQHFSLEEIGIPCRVNGLKLIFTTRLLNVCRKMGCQEIIQVGPLSEDEAWNLFLEKLVPEGGEISWQKDPEIKETAMSMAKRCCSLPLAIITVARSMMGVNDIHEWRNALRELKESITKQGDMEDDVFLKLKFSYKRVKDEKLRDCFLYCALYPEDYRIRRDELIPKFIAEGLIDRMKTRQAQFDKGHSMLNELENACLLESCKEYEHPCVKMHDLIREMALKIASHRLMVRAGMQSKKIPKEEEWTEDLKRISLMENFIEVIPRGMSPRCPRLSTLILQYNSGLKRIPCSFFKQMSALRVLDLSYTGIVNLPHIISDLKNLTALFLSSCKNLTRVPPLGKLKALQLLDLSYTKIEEIPQGMEMLVNLKCLYMDGIGSLELFPCEIFDKLSGLQVVRTGSIQIRVKELERLGQLEEFEGCLCTMIDFNRYVQSNHYRQLNTCRLHVGEYSYGVVYEYEKEAVFKNCQLENGGEDTLLLLPHNIKRLIISDCDNVSSLCDVSRSLISARDLKESKMGYHGIECMSSSSSSSSWNQVEEERHCSPLQSIEKLELYNLPELSGLIKGLGVTATPPGTLSNLQMLDIRCCNKMKKLLTPRLLENLPNIQTIRVVGCDEMEEIIGDDEDELMVASNNHPSSSSSTIFTFPNLRVLYLHNLERLESICKGSMVCYSLEVIHTYDCPKLKRLPFSLPLVNGQPSPPISLRKIDFYPIGWWESLEWDHPNAKDALQPFLVYI
ncbi:probable disease resistance protein At4g27220 [Cornus florida]|uniref:probable disease resistance protein At4g27220 n=1 Tax=Cornus florida TaxID=4283 RepID=UPI00289BC5C3|nr:probable disease resistance protein At4g27220 [Cornus florida]